MNWWKRLFGKPEKTDTDVDMKKFLIVGLGNIGPEYVGTRHNAGFMVADRLAADAGVAFQSCRYGDMATVKVKNCLLMVLKPSTFMNLSGVAVRYWMNHEKLPLENLLVVVDDIALPFGVLRMRTGGSDAGHNGLKNIASSATTAIRGSASAWVTISPAADRLTSCLASSRPKSSRSSPSAWE